MIGSVANTKLTGTITNAQIAASAITEAKIAGNAITAAKIKANSINTAEIVANSITTLTIAANAVGAAQISSIDADKIDVDVLKVKKFANVSSTIESHVSGEFVPLQVFGSSFQRGSTNFTVQTQTTGTYLSTTIGDVRNGAKYQAIWTGVYGDCTNGVLEYSVNGGTSYSTAAGGISSVTMAAGTFRTYVFVYSGTISGLPTTGTNRKNVLWRVRWITKLRSTYQSLYVFIDNTQ